MLSPLTHIGGFLRRQSHRRSQGDEGCRPGGGGAQASSLNQPRPQSLGPTWIHSTPPPPTQPQCWDPALGPGYLSRLAAHKEVAEELAGRAPGVSGHEGKLAVSWAPGGIKDALQGVSHQEHLGGSKPADSIRRTTWPANAGQRMQPCGRHALASGLLGLPSSLGAQLGAHPAPGTKNSALLPGLPKPRFPWAPSSFTGTLSSGPLPWAVNQLTGVVVPSHGAEGQSVHGLQGHRDRQ